MNRLATSFAELLDPQFEYVFTQGPDKATNLHEAAEHGMNCVSVAHWLLDKLTGHRLPTDMYCFEMFYSSVFEAVRAVREMRIGDLVWLGNPANGRMQDSIPDFADGQMANWGGCPVNHIGVFTGRFAWHNDPLILHASSVEGTNVVQPLSAMARVPNWSHVYGIKRLAV